jgi:hypothetical protein
MIAGLESSNAHCKPNPLAADVVMCIKIGVKIGAMVRAFPGGLALQAAGQGVDKNLVHAASG